MPTTRRGLRLVATNGHSHWADPELRMLAINPVDGSGGGTALFGFAVDCDFGGVPLTHWLMREREGGRVTWRTAPYYFPSQAEAEAARDELATQQGGEDG